MKNSVICPNCKTQNPFYNSICSNCRFYIRQKIINLDLFSLLASIIESPAKAFKTIIFSEHKNFIFFIFLLVCVKYLINARFVSMLTINQFQSTIGLEVSYSIVVGITLVIFLLFSILYTVTGKLTNISVRIKDTIAVLIYSQIPFVFGLVVLFSLELVIFGDYLFSINPTPFVIKGFIAYLFLLLEISLIIWSSFLVFKGFQTQTNVFSFSFLAAALFIVLLICLIYIYSLFVFTV